MENKDFRVKLDRIELIDFQLNRKPLESSTEVFDFDITIQTKILSKREILIQVVNVTLKDKADGEKIFATISVMVGFLVENLVEALKFNEADGSFKMPIEIDSTIKSIAVSTVRGILFGLLRGTYLHDAILPIIPIPFPETKENMQSIVGGK